jgi:arsenate reductase-like glutaredoxin family protein
MMDFAFLILVIGVVFWINQPSIDEDKLKTIAKSIDKELTKEFKKRDDKIKELEKRTKRIEDTVVEKGLSNE